MYCSVRSSAYWNSFRVFTTLPPSSAATAKVAPPPVLPMPNRPGCPGSCCAYLVWSNSVDSDTGSEYLVSWENMQKFSPCDDLSPTPAARQDAPMLARPTTANRASNSRVASLRSNGGMNVNRSFPLAPVDATDPIVCCLLSKCASLPVTPWMMTRSPILNECTRRVRTFAFAVLVTPLYVAQSGTAAAVTSSVSPWNPRMVQPPSLMWYTSSYHELGSMGFLSGLRSLFFQNVFFSPKPPPINAAYASAAPASKWFPVFNFSRGVPVTCTASLKVTKK